jgi:hypothetical protein
VGNANMRDDDGGFIDIHIERVSTNPGAASGQSR